MMINGLRGGGHQGGAVDAVFQRGANSLIDRVQGWRPGTAEALASRFVAIPRIQDPNNRQVLIEESNRLDPIQRAIDGLLNGRDESQLNPVQLSLLETLRNQQERTLGGMRDLIQLDYFQNTMRQLLNGRQREALSEAERTAYDQLSAEARRINQEINTLYEGLARRLTETAPDAIDLTRPSRQGTTTFYDLATPLFGAAGLFALAGAEAGILGVLGTSVATLIGFVWYARRGSSSARNATDPVSTVDLTQTPNASVRLQPGEFADIKIGERTVRITRNRTNNPGEPQYSLTIGTVDILGRFTASRAPIDITENSVTFTEGGACVGRVAWDSSGNLNIQQRGANATPPVGESAPAAPAARPTRGVDAN